MYYQYDHATIDTVIQMAWYIFQVSHTILTGRVCLDRVQGVTPQGNIMPAFCILYVTVQVLTKLHRMNSAQMPMYGDCGCSTSHACVEVLKR